MTAPARRIRNVYVHAPFCARRCRYCDFAVEVDRRPDGAAWLAAIRAELDWAEGPAEIPLAPSLETLYVGGGTPSVLDPRLVAQLAAVVGRGRTRAPGFEWTVEANPESFDGRVARRWAEGGVNRVSFGVQSFDRGALRWMGRLHAPADAGKSVRAARAAGVHNLSVDLIFGLPGTVPRDWRADLERALGLEVPHVSLYGLTVEKGTPLARAVGEGRVAPCGDERYRDEYLLAAETLALAGYDHYEVSNFALPGFESRHNAACWRGAPYLGLGNGAHSHHDGRRWWNERAWPAYRDRVARSGSGRAGSERPTPRQARLERLWLALRTAAGLDAAAFNTGDPPASDLDAATLSTAASSVTRRWVAAGLAERENATVRLTPDGWLVLDELTLELDAALERSESRTPRALPLAARSG